MHESTTENENARKQAHDMAFILIRLKTFPPTESVENGRNGTQTGIKDIAYKYTFIQYGRIATHRIAIKFN